MRFDFSDLGFRKTAFWDRPFTFFEPATREFMTTMMEISAIETGDRAAREHWQKQQIGRLLQHAAARSPFWKKRLGPRNLAEARLASLPVLTRPDVAGQVAAEGALLPETQGPLISHSTSGSTGSPIRFFITPPNTRYNSARVVAQYLMEGRDLLLNRTRFKLSESRLPGGLRVSRQLSWLGPVGAAISSGANREIEISNPDFNLLRKELRAEPIGYLIASPKTISILLQHFDLEFFTRQGTRMWISYAEAVDENLRRDFIAAGMEVTDTYSAEEVGPIAHECRRSPGHYHVAHSNVVVEIADDLQVPVPTGTLGRVLVTHLHSYATPFIRYDIGDVAMSHERCPCGHDGKTLSGIRGRTKGLIKHADGSLSVFFITGDEMRAAATFEEYRIRQVSPSSLVVEIGGRERLEQAEIDGLRSLLGARAGADIVVSINPTPKIDWGANAKRLGFHNEIIG